MMEGCQSAICILSDDALPVVEAVRALPRRGSAFVSEPIGGWVVVFEESSDGPPEDRLNEYTAVLSETLCTTAIGFLIVESDLLVYTLARDSRVLDYFNSWPDYFDETLQTDDEDSPSGDTDLLIAEVGPNARAEDIRAILDGEYDFAEERLAALTTALGLPAVTAQWGYHLLEQEEDVPCEFARVPAPFRILPDATGQ